MENFKRLPKEKREELVTYTVEAIKELPDDVEASEVHFHLFNEDYYIIGRYQAEQWLEGFTFQAIEAIREYEQTNFGEVNTDFSDPEKVVNMFVYIVGEEILSESETLSEIWDERLTKTEQRSIAAEIAGLA